MHCSKTYRVCSIPIVKCRTPTFIWFWSTGRSIQHVACWYFVDKPFCYEFHLKKMIFTHWTNLWLLFYQHSVFLDLCRNFGPFYKIFLFNLLQPTLEPILWSFVWKELFLKRIFKFLFFCCFWKPHTIFECHHVISSAPQIQIFLEEPSSLIFD